MKQPLVWTISIAIGVCSILAAGWYRAETELDGLQRRVAIHVELHRRTSPSCPCCCSTEPLPEVQP